VLQVRDLRVWYSVAGQGKRKVLHGVGLDIDKGESLGIRGRSGSGKSTLALAILNALPAGASREGLVEFRGTAMSPVFQEATGALHPMMTAGEQIMEAVRARRGLDARQRTELAAVALEMCGLSASHYFGAWPHEMSGGQKQRTLIAQAIAGEPDLLIADEPTGSLDGKTQQEIVKLFRDLRRRTGLSILLISHSERLLAELTDRVRTIREGLIE
jgi:ABC-type glutathione transport system ATPase component